MDKIDSNISDTGHLTTRHLAMIAREGGIKDDTRLGRHLQECELCRNALRETKSQHDDLRQLKRDFFSEARQRRQDRSY